MTSPKYLFFKSHPEAPAYEEHAPLFSEDTIVAYFDMLTEDREAKISDLMAKDNKPRFFAAMEVDTDRDNLTTQAEILRSIGVVVPIPEDIEWMDAKTIHLCLWTIIYGLARLNTYLVNTDHLSDKQLLERLVSNVLIDEIPLVVPNEDMAEFIDLNPTHQDPIMLDSVDEELNPIKVPFVRPLPTLNDTRATAGLITFPYVKN